MHEKDKAKAIIQLANKALSSHDEDHLPALFNQIYRLWAGETNTIEVALQDHDGNVTPFVKITQSDIVITVLINHIVSYLTDAQFPPQHLEALWKIVRLFNDSDDSESQVFAFAAQFYDYFAGPEEARRRYEIDNFPKAEEIFPVNGMDEAASAVEIAQSLNIDDAVREVAQSGTNHDKNHGFGPNWYAIWGGMSFSATFGAGTNSANVVMVSNDEATNHLLLYSALDYGRRIETFRTGPWVNRLLAHADELRQANKIKAQEREAEKVAQKKKNFKKVNF